MGFDFEGVDAFQASPDQWVPEGNYHFKVVQADDDTTSTNKPCINLKFECPEGTAWDTLVITDAEFSRRKVAGLFAAAGVQIKNDMFSDDGHCKQAILNEHILGKTVGGIVRMEEDNRPDHYGESRPRVKGYCEVTRVATPGPLNRGPLPTPPGTQTGGGQGLKVPDVPIETAGLPNGGQQAALPGAPAPGEPVIPFHHDDLPLDYEPFRGHANR